MSKKLRLLGFIGLVPLILVLSACDLGQVSGTLGQLQQLASTCPKGHHIATYIGDDLSQNDRSMSLSQERLSEIRAAATYTAVCGGVIQVNGFSASDADTQTLFGGPLEPSGATLNARLLKVTPMVDAVMKIVSSDIPKAMSVLPASATDITSQLTLIAQFAQQQGAGDLLYGWLLTSGLQTTGEVVTNVDLTEAAASDLGNRVSVPALPGSVMTIAGLGVVASGPPPPSSYVQSLITFFTKACARTGATCIVSINPVTSIEGS
jgi:hypothetical protein